MLLCLSFPGNYVCTARNGVGKGPSRLVALEVEFSPQIRVPRPRVPQAPGYDAELVCRITAFPPPSIIWRRQGDGHANNSIDNSDQVQITHFAEEDDVTVSTLRVRKGGGMERNGNLIPTRMLSKY